MAPDNPNQGLDPRQRPKVIVAADPTALAKTAAERLIARIVANAHRPAICLSGGSSPKQMFELLATDAWRGRIPWDRVHWFIGDERFVPVSDSHNNMAMARKAFLDRCAPPANVHPIEVDSASPDEAARRYERELKSFYGADELDISRPLFDVVLLGVGPDGHTASLFPGYPATEETARWVVGVPQAHVEKGETLLVLWSAATTAIGIGIANMGDARNQRGKTPPLLRLGCGERQGAHGAAVKGSEEGNHVSPGETVWLVDEAALPEDFSGR